MSLHTPSNIIGGGTGIVLPTTNRIVHLNASNIVMNGNYVSQMTDISGNGNHAKQTVETSQPLLVNNYMGTNPALLFDGVNDFFEFDNYIFNGKTSLSIFLQIRLVASANAGVLGSSNGYSNLEITAGLGTRIRNNNYDSSITSGDEFSVISKVNSATYSVFDTQISILAENGSAIVRRNGYEGNYTASNCQLPIADNIKIAIGRYAVNNYANMYISELIIYDSKLSGDDLTNVELWLKNKYRNPYNG